MARLARVVVPGFPHHVTQRGNLQQDIFFGDNDRRMYLRLLRDQRDRCGIRILAWCLMSNHVHLVAMPSRENSFAEAIGRAERAYAHWIHLQEGQIGHLWQSRFFSCPLEGGHLWDAIRYVELNPVRAGLVRDPVDWRWSSASAHVWGTDESGLTDMAWWRDQWQARQWEEALVAGWRDAEFAERLREATRTGRPLGSEIFMRSLETAMQRSLLPRKRGPKPRPAALAGQGNLGI